MNMKWKLSACLLGSIILVTGFPIQSQAYIWTERGCNATYAVAEPVTIFFKTFYGEPFEVWVSRPLFGSKLALEGIGDDSVKSTTIILGAYPGEVSFILTMPCIEPGINDGFGDINFNATETITMCEVGSCTIYIEESDGYVYEPPDNGGYLIGDDDQVNNYAVVEGLDVSSHNGDIDWEKVKEAGFKFAFIRATVGGDGEHNDKKFSENIKNAKNVGLIVGAYHFACPDIDYDNKPIMKDAENIKSILEKDAKEEATNFFTVAGQYMTEGYLKPALDIENQTGDREIDLHSDQLVFWVDVFVKKLMELTKVNNGIEIEPLIYCNKNYAESKFTTGDTYQDVKIKKITEYDLWITDIKDEGAPDTKIWETWAFWQYEVRKWEEVPGFSECDGVDLDKYNGDMDSLKENYIIKKIESSPPPASPPPSSPPSESPPESPPMESSPPSTNSPDEGSPCCVSFIFCNICLMLIVLNNRQSNSGNDF